MTYSTSILETAGIGIARSKAQFFTVGIGCFMLLIPLFNVYAVDRLRGRKVLFPIPRGRIVAITVVAVLCGQGSKPGTRRHHVATAYGAAAVIIIFLLFFGLTEPVVLFMASEMFDQASRGMVIVITILTVISTPNKPSSSSSTHRSAPASASRAVFYPSSYVPLSAQRVYIFGCRRQRGRQLAKSPRTNKIHTCLFHHSQPT